MINRLILNGKSSDLIQVRDAVNEVRKLGHTLQVRTTWEQGDATLFAKEAAEQGIQRVIAAGGDGTLHEVLNGLMQSADNNRPEMGIVPLGTANDFALSCGIPLSTFEALRIAVQEKTSLIDIGKMNDIFFLNMITAGFGAEVTVSTPPEMKKLLGGTAYSLMGLLLAFNFKPYEGEVKLPDIRQQISAVVGVIGNGRQAGGGKELTTKAYLNDGLLDVMILHNFTTADVPQVINEVNTLSENGQFVSYYQTAWAEFKYHSPIPINLDGEPHQLTKARVEVIPNALKLVLPDECPLIQ